MSRLIAFRMVFLAQGESPTSCAGELGRNPAAPMLQHIVQKNILLITGSASEAGPGFRAGAGIASEYHLRAATRYGRMLPKLQKRHPTPFTNLYH